MICHRASNVAIVLLAALGLSGCAGDGIEFNGKIFEAVGLNSLGGNRPDPVEAQRNGLVIPPKQAALPRPGEGTEVTASVSAQLPNDPDKLLKEQAAAAEAERLKKCKEQENSANRDGTAPPCNSILKALTGKNLGELATGQ